MVGKLPSTLALLLALISAGAALAGTADLKPHKIGPKDKCPVCGMFVSKFPDFAAEIQFKDGAVVHFDGAKDMFTYYLNLSRYAPGRKTADIGAVFVTDYYDLAKVDGLSAHYVVGSDVYGPMGRELIPFGSESKAGDFRKDHRGKRTIRLRDVTPTLLKQLD